MLGLNEHITSLIVAQLKGAASEKELAELEQWLASDTSHAALYTELKTIIYSKPIQHSEEETSKAFKNIKEQIAQKGKSTHPIPLKTKAVFPIIKLLGVAASILLIILIYWEVQRYWAKGHPPVTITKDCPRGEKLHFSFSDGTEVWLNSDSRITFPEYFASNNRSVGLEGEAFFNVVKNKQKPFIVNTSNSKIKVLGTSFNVNNRNIENITETTVISGIVLVSSTLNNESVTLVKNQHVSVNSQGQLLKVDKIDPKSIVDWKDNNLFFDNIPLSEVFKEIEPWFDIKILVKDKSLYRKRLRAKFSNPSLTQLLDHISKVMDIDYRLEGKTVTILKSN